MGTCHLCKVWSETVNQQDHGKILTLRKNLNKLSSATVNQICYCIGNSNPTFLSNYVLNDSLWFTSAILPRKPFDISAQTRYSQESLRFIQMDRVRLHSPHLVRVSAISSDPNSGSVQYIGLTSGCMSAATSNALYCTATRNPLYCTVLRIASGDTPYTQCRQTQSWPTLSQSNSGE